MKNKYLRDLCLIISILFILTACNAKGLTSAPSPALLQVAIEISSPTEPPLRTEIPKLTETPEPTTTPQPTETQSPTKEPSPTITPLATAILSPTGTLVVVNDSISTRIADGMVMVYVPVGEFIMGNNAGPMDERPQHTVFLDAFWIDKTEVTNAMFTQFIQATGYQTDAEKGGSAWAFDGSSWSKVIAANWQHPQGPSTNLTGLENHPVVNVTWYDATAYCQWTGSRLPSEAEWEKAARGTDGSTYPWGEQEPYGNLLNFADINISTEWADKNLNDGYKFTAPVGSYPEGVSPYRALDMAGNVWEWVNDWYQETYYTVAPTSNPAGPNSGDGRVLRGGSWNHNLQDIHASMRLWSKPYEAIDNFGFRCALSAP
jgi:formylglycine-generating enzyme required for sulfatase activity